MVQNIQRIGKQPIGEVIFDQEFRHRQQIRISRIFCAVALQRTQVVGVPELATQLREANFDATLVIQEIMQTKPGRQDDYIRELERLYVPWSERTGKRWLGSFITTFRFNEVIHYWALDGGWDCFENHYPSWKDSPPAEIVTWMSVAPALRDGWEDSILQALPPSPLQ